MALFQWRRFQFFDKELLTAEGGAGEDGKTGTDTLPLFKDGFVPKCGTSGRGFLIFGDEKGLIRIINRDFEVQTFTAYEGGDVIQVHQLKRSPVLVSVGREAGEPVVKIWRLDQVTEEGNPTCAAALKVLNSKLPPANVTCFSVLEDLSQLAVGLSNGQVLLWDGNLLRGERGCRQIMLQKEGKIVTNVEFREDSNPAAVCLFVVTSDEVCSYFTKHRSLPRIQLDQEGGGDLGCSVLNEEKKLVVARENAVYFYEAEEKGVCFGFEGAKKRLAWFGSYLVLVCETKELSAAGVHRDSLTIYDLKGKFVAFTAKFDSIALIVAEWGALFVITETGKMYQLSEKDLATKMEMLFKKNLYSIAISLANSQDLDKSYVMEIFQMYGDHLYDKGDYDGAITQYIETIRYVEPSYVIRKFLDAQRIHNLTRYLQALHEKGRANKDHTTLLLNCYTKLKDVKKLDEFIKTDSGLTFDVHTAIRVCRQAGYSEHALYLAHKHREHALYLKIQLEDEGNYKDALAYIASLEFADAERFMREHGMKLMSQLPDETTQLLIQLCTNYRPTPLPSGADSKPNTPACSSSSSASGTASSQPALAAPAPAPVNPLPPLISEAAAAAATPAPQQQQQAAPEQKSGSRARPEDFIHLFVGRNEHLQRFLEAVLQEPRQSPVLFNTLLELYLQQEAAEEARERQDEQAGRTHTDKRALPSKIIALLKNPHVEYDVDHALVLCKRYGFDKGVTYLLGRLRLYQEILQHHMANKQHKHIIRACRKYGDQDSSLWITALNYLATSPDATDQEIAAVLEQIERKNLLPPLMVVQILAQNPTKPLSVIKDYLIRTLSEESKLIVSDQRDIANYEKDTRAMKAEIEQLRTHPTTFQGSKCHLCNTSLALPAVHFLCMHSFHQRCLADSDRECPKCSPEYRKVKDIRESMLASANQHDRFYRHLDEASDGFAAVAEYFGRGILDEVPPPQQPRPTLSSD